MGWEYSPPQPRPASTTVLTVDRGKLVFGIFAALAEFERELISERTLAGSVSARARGRNGGRPYKMTPAGIGLKVPTGQSAAIDTTTASGNWA